MPPSTWRCRWDGRTTSGSCAPRATRTYHNARREGVFTVSYPRPMQVVLASLAAAPREGDGSKPAVDVLPTFPASEVDGIFIEDAYLFLECVLDRISDDFGENSLIAGRIVAAHVSEDYLRASERDDKDLIHELPAPGLPEPGTLRVRQGEQLVPFPCRTSCGSGMDMETGAQGSGLSPRTATDAEQSSWNVSRSRSPPRPSRGRRKRY